MPLDLVEKAELQAMLTEHATRSTESITAANARADKLEAEFKDYKTSQEQVTRRAAIYGSEMHDRDMNASERLRYVANAIGDKARAVILSKMSGQSVVSLLRGQYKNERAATEWEASSTRSLAEGTFADGGALVDTMYYPELIQLLYPMAVVRKAGARVLPMPGGNLTMQRVTAGVQGAYAGELANIAVQQESLGQVNFSAKKLAVIIPVSQELLTDATGQINSLIISDLGRGISLKEDLTFLRSDGSSNTPIGLRYAINPGFLLSAGVGLIATPTLADTLQKLRAKIMGANLPMEKIAWVMNSDLESAFYNKLSSIGTYVYRDEMNDGKLLGFPFYRTNQIASNYTLTGSAGGALTELYFGDFSEAIIAETDTLRIDTSTEGSFLQGSTLVSAFSTDQTLFRAKERHDFGLRHTNAFSIALINPAIIL